MLYRFARKLVTAKVRISETERIALAAGSNNSVTDTLESRLFRGESIGNIINPLTPPNISEEARQVIANRVQPLCDSVNNYQIAKQGGLDRDQLDLCRPLFGLGIPKSHGGLELNIHDQSQIVQYVASRSVVGGVTVMVPNSLGPAELIQHYGTAEQQDQYLHRLATGELVPCFGLTGVFSGSDAANMLDTGTLFRDPVTGEVKISINCEKRYITLAPVADLVGLAFRLSDPERLLPELGNGYGTPGITVALLERDTPELQLGDRHDPMGLGLWNGTVEGNNITIPVESVVGGADQVGQGWKMLMECLTVGRGVSLPAASTASLKMASTYTGAYARVRSQFGRSIAELQGVQEHLAEITAQTTIAVCSQHLYSAIADQSPELVSPTLSAILKWSTTERARVAVNRSMDVLGGMGICDGPNNVMAGLYHSLPIPITVEGSNTLTRSLIVYGQGLLRGKDDLRGVWESIEAEDVDSFYRCLWSVIGKGTLDVGRSVVENFIPHRIEHLIAGSNSGYATHLASNFGALVTLSIPILPDLKRCQVFSGAMADLIARLYEIDALEWMREHHPEAIPKPLYHYCLTNLVRDGYQSLAVARTALAESNVALGTLAKLCTLIPSPDSLVMNPSEVSEIANLITQNTPTRKWLEDGIDVTHPMVAETKRLMTRTLIGGKMAPTQQEIRPVLMVDTSTSSG